MVIIDQLEANDVHVYNSQGGEKVPVVILTGYLGAGKTTLLNYILREQGEKKLAVIENEVGEVSIDDALVEEKVQDTDHEIVTLSNGCICCNIRGDLVRTLAAIAERRSAGMALDGVLIELTGVADPAPVVQTFFMHDDVENLFYVDNVVALVDAKHAMDKLDESQDDPKERGTACAQIAFSSTVLLNKIDLADGLALGAIERRIKEINPSAAVIRCQEGRVPMSALFNVGVFDLGRVLEEQYMDEKEFHSFYKPKMDHSVSNVGIRCAGALNLMAFQEFLDKYLDQEETAQDFLRVKAVLDIAGSDSKFVTQCVHMVRNGGFAETWADGQPRENRIIFIGRGMQARRQELTQGFTACIAQPLRFKLGLVVKVKVGCGHQHHKGEDHRHEEKDPPASESEAERAVKEAEVPLGGWAAVLPDWRNMTWMDRWAAMEKHAHDPRWLVGSVVAHWHEHYAYLVKLLCGPAIQVPMDDDRFIMSNQSTSAS